MNAGFPERGLPSERSIDIWKIDLDREVGSGWRPEGLLSAEELERARRLVRAVDAERFRRCRAMLRLGLGRYLGQRPERIEIESGWRGKPRLAEGSRLRFNVSHTGGVALLAFTTVGEVGVDVEMEGREVEAKEIADLYFHPKEANWIDAGLTDGERKGRFLRIWTRKEAAMKAAGCGIAEGLEAFDVSGGPRSEVALRGADGEARWQVRDLEVGDGCFAAVAAEPGEWTIRQFEPVQTGWMERPESGEPG